MTDVAGNPEEERRADYFYQPWCQEAVCRYFYGKVKKKTYCGFIRLSDCCLTPTQQFSAILWRETVNFQ